VAVDDAAFKAALDAMVVRVEAAAARLGADAAGLIEASAKKQDSYTTRSGTNRRSIHTERGEMGGYLVGPSAVYSRRLELGFQGPDSLGRVYNQKPRPYMKPGRSEALPGIISLARRRFAAAIRG
jgi:hypothetical protein